MTPPSPMDPESAFSLKGRTALVTGSSRGIGAAIATTLAHAGADLVIHCAADESAGQAMVESIRSLGRKAMLVSCDLSSPDSASEIHARARSTFDKIDILVLNASIQLPRHWTEIPTEDIHLQVAVNFTSSLLLLQLFVPEMATRGWGRVLTIGSVQERVPNPEMLVYSALKNAQTAVGHSLAKQYASHGITINNLAPGVIETDRYLKRVVTAEHAERVRSWIPAGHVGQPEDCVGLALLLCSDAGKYITGQNIFVDGGMSS